MSRRPHATLSLLILALCVLPRDARAQALQCGDCDLDGSASTILDALRASQIAASLLVPGAQGECSCDVDASGTVTVLDGLRIAQAAAGLGVTILCPTGATCGTQISGCRVVDSLGAPAGGPTGLVPAYAPVGAGAPPPSGDIADTNPDAMNYWDFDYVGGNQGEFNLTVQLTDAAGANVGNPVILFSAGHDYRPVDVDPVAPCNSVDTFQLVLEADVDAVLRDLTGPSTVVNGAMVDTTWSSSDPSTISVSAGALLTAMGENGCVTIDWMLSSGSPAIVIDPMSASGAIAACVDSGGVDTSTRGLWLPVGDVDGNLVGMPSGRPAPGVGGTTGITWVINTGGSGLGAYGAKSGYDEMVLNEAQGVDTSSIGGSTQTGLGLTFAVSVSTPGLTRWNDVDALARNSGIFDLASQTFTATGSGTSAVILTMETLADGVACSIWSSNPCLPFSSYTCPMAPPMTGYQTIAGSGEVSIP